MASIIEHNCQWALTNEFARKLEAQGKLKECDAEHDFPGLMDLDLPIYHTTKDAGVEGIFLMLAERTA